MTFYNTTVYSGRWKFNKSYMASFELYPEKKGNTFLAFKGRAHHCHEYWTQTNVMVKTFRSRPATATNCKIYRRAAKVARKHAILFNMYAELTGYSQKVMFVRPTSVVMDDRSDITPILSKIMRFKKTFTVDEYVVFEDYLKGEFSTFVSSCGQATGSGSAHLAAYCHYTYHQSNGQFVVCNLQGVEEGDIFRLTNPTIHSRSGQYGPNDKGDSGITTFFANHVCKGGICGNFIRPYIDDSSSIIPKKVWEADHGTPPLPYTSGPNIAPESPPPPYALVDPMKYL